MFIGNRLECAVISLQRPAKRQDTAMPLIQPL